MGWRERVVDVARFVVQPTYVARPMERGPGFLTAFVLLAGLSMVLVPLMRVLIELALGPSDVLPEVIDKTVPTPGVVLEYVVIAPLLEELLFRGWMDGRKAGLRFAAYGVAALAMLLVALAVPQDGGRVLSIAAVASVYIGLIHWGATRDRDRAVPDWFIRRFRWMVWCSSLVFGLIHLGRFEALTHPLGVLVVAPLMLGGMLLAYTRTRLGLFWAMLSHACYNVMVVGLVIALA